MAVIFPIKSTFDPTGVNQAKKAFNGLSGSVSSSSNLMRAALVGIGASTVVKGLQSAVMAASNLSESIAKSNTVFGRNAAEIESWSKSTAKSLGVTQQSALEAAGTYGNLFRAFGIQEGESAKMSKALVTLAADLASFNNVPIEDALLALRSGLSGETEPLKRFGIAINEVRLKQEALNLKIYDGNGVLTQAQKTQAAYALIMKDSSLAQGDVARTAGGLANQLKFLSAGLQDAKAGFGEALLPAALSVVKGFNDKVLPALQVFINALTGKTSVGSSLSQSEQTALNWGNTIRAVFQTVINYRGEIVAFGAVIVGVFAVAKIAAAASAIVSIIKGVIGVYRALQTAAVLAATASAFASGGLSVGAGIAGAAVGVAAVTATLAGVNAVVNTYQKNVADLPKINIAPDGVLADAKVYKDVVLPTVDNVGKAGKKAGKGLKEIGDAAKYIKAQIAAFTDELSKANGVLDNARQAFSSFKSSVADTLSGILDFGAAATAETGSFVENLVAQAAKAANFGTKIQQLLGMGLSESAIAKVLEAGADAGTKIADEIIAGGATVVNQVNSLITATQSVADAVGESAATQFYTAGITAGQALVDGVKAAIAAAGFAVNTEGVVVNQAGIDQVNAAVAKARTKKSKGGKKITKGEKKSISDLANALGVDIPAMAAGGIVTGPTLALIGEAGPEAVIPLNRNNTPTGNTINLTVNAGMGADGNQIGREIVDAIKRYERISGPVFKSA
jgi:hypothetical protein